MVFKYLGIYWAFQLICTKALKELVHVKRVPIFKDSARGINDSHVAM